MGSKSGRTAVSKGCFRGVCLAVTSFRLSRDSDTRWYHEGVLLLFPQSVCSSSSLSASQMEKTMKLLKRRLQSRIALHRQFASLGTFPAPPTGSITHNIFGFNRSYVIRAQHHPSFHWEFAPVSCQDHVPLSSLGLYHLWRLQGVYILCVCVCVTLQLRLVTLKSSVFVVFVGPVLYSTCHWCWAGKWNWSVLHACGGEGHR